MKEAAYMAKKLRQRANIGGKQQWLTGSTQQEIFDAYLKQAIESGVVAVQEETCSSHPSSPLFKTCAWRWFEVYKLPKLRDNTAYNYRRNMETHILPVFGNRHIASIQPSDIQSFLNSKQDKAGSTVHHLWLILHGVFSIAKWDGYIEKDRTKTSNAIR